MKRSTHCAMCGNPFGLLQVRIQHHNIEGEVCETCDSIIERKRRIVREEIERSKQ